MKKVTSLLMLLLALLTGCVTQVSRVITTASGKPEVTIATSDVGRIKSMIIGDLVNYGYTVETDTAYSLSLSRKMKDMEQFATALSIGNAYSSNSQLSNYTFVRDGNTTRVIFSGMLRAQLPGGQINTLPLDDNNFLFNEIINQLNEIKIKIETAPSL